MYTMIARWLLRHASTYITLLIFMPSPFVTAFGIPDFLEFGSCADTKMEPKLDLYRYSGVWFAQEMVPNEYTKIAACSMNNYTYRGDVMTVVERGLSADGRKVRSNSIIRRSDDGRYTVDAEGVPSAPFEVVATDYENYACAYSCMSFMGFRAAFSWVYTRQPEPDQTYIVLCRSLLSEQGIDPTPLKPVQQGKDCPYMDKISRILAYSKSVQDKAKAKAQEKAKTLKVSQTETAEKSTDSTLNEEVQRLGEMEREIQNEEERLLQEMEEERQRMEEARQGDQEERRRLEDERRIIEEQRTRLEEESIITKQERKEEKEALVELREDVRAEIRRNHRGSRHRSDGNIAENSSSHLYNNGIATVLLSLSLAALMTVF